MALDEAPDRTRNLIAHIAAGTQLSDASKLAGYSPKHGRMLANRPDVQGAVRQSLQRRLLMDGSPKAIAYLVELIDDVEASKTVRMQAAMAILDRAGLAKGSSHAGEISLSDLPREALLRLVQGAESELAGRALPADSAPDAPAAASDDVDIFG